mmetsp:Transcript_7486/g.21329  ORF Transcript_7486/g.21329 Transcript_7486/m.21329 type:complete len:237 (+) Transcript_7486:2062-2772(+)
MQRAADGTPDAIEGQVEEAHRGDEGQDQERLGHRQDGLRAVAGEEAEDIDATYDDEEGAGEAPGAELEPGDVPHVLRQILLLLVLPHVLETLRAGDGVHCLPVHQKRLLVVLADHAGQQVVPHMIRLLVAAAEEKPHPTEERHIEEDQGREDGGHPKDEVVDLLLLAPRRSVRGQSPRVPFEPEREDRNGDGAIGRAGGAEEHSHIVVVALERLQDLKPLLDGVDGVRLRRHHALP